MLIFVCALSLTLAGGAGEPRTHFAQVHPERDEGCFARSAGRERAVILVHGFRYTLHKENVGRADLQEWQEAGGLMVRSLGKEADVFAFAYGQDGTLDGVARSKGLADGVRTVRDLKYKEIVLVGFSAG